MIFETVHATLAEKLPAELCTALDTPAGRQEALSALLDRHGVGRVLFRNTREAFIDHERAKSELKALMPEDAKEAVGHGVRGKRSKSGAVSFDVLEREAAHAPVQ